MSVLSFDLSKVKVVRLSKIYDLAKFDCGETDLNEFIKQDALKYEQSRLATTYLLIYEDKFVGFFSLVNDSIRLMEDEKDDKEFPENLSDFPATKIARLAVDKEWKKKKFGTLMINLVIGITLECKHCASRFITVDSLPESVKFYEINGFIRNQHSRYTKKDDFISMRFDLFNSTPNSEQYSLSVEDLPKK